MNESLTLYKLIGLYMLKNSSSPLTNAQITEFVLEKEYTDYFTLQQAIGELIDSELIRVEESKSGTFYHLTAQGEETLSYFKDKISEGIIEDMNDYIKSNSLAIINNASIIADYYKAADLGYDVSLRIRERNRIIFDLSLNVDTKSEAEQVCKNFKAKNEEIYEYVIKRLMC